MHIVTKKNRRDERCMQETGVDNTLVTLVTGRVGIRMDTAAWLDGYGGLLAALAPSDRHLLILFITLHINKIRISVY